MSPSIPPAWWSRLTQHVLMAQRWTPQALTFEELEALPFPPVIDPRDWQERWRLLDRCCVRTHTGARIYGGIYPYDWHGPLPWLSL